MVTIGWLTCLFWGVDIEHVRASWYELSCYHRIRRCAIPPRPQTAGCYFDLQTLTSTPNTQATTLSSIPTESRNLQFRSSTRALLAVASATVQASLATLFLLLVATVDPGSLETSKVNRLYTRSFSHARPICQSHPFFYLFFWLWRFFHHDVTWASTTTSKLTRPIDIININL